MRRRLGSTVTLLALIVAAAAAELAVRLLDPQAVLLVDRGLYAPDPPRRYRLAPGFRGRITNRVEFDTLVTINRAGTRGPEMSASATGGLLGLGDSFAFGVGVEDDEAWPLVLARSQAVEGANAGTPGFGVPDAVDWFEAHGAPLAPSLAVLGVFTGNDLQDATPGVPRVAVRDGALVVAGERPGLGHWLYRRSHLFLLAKQAALWERLRGGESWARAELRREMALFEDPHAFAEGAAATAAAFQRFAHLARMHGVRPVVALFPTLPQVDQALWTTTASALGLDPARLDRDAPNRRLADLARGQGLEVVDITPRLRAAVAAGEMVYFPIDRHLTPRGHAVAAAEIARAL
jgi:hypothetical protein